MYTMPQVREDVERGAGPTQLLGEMTYFGKLPPVDLPKR